MEAIQYTSRMLEFQYLSSCEVRENNLAKEQGVVELAHMYEAQRIGRLYVRFHFLKEGQDLAVLANEHRQELLKHQVEVFEGTLVSSPIPNRFDEAAYFAPPCRSNGVSLDSPTVIYRQGPVALSISLIGPTERTSEYLWRGNQKAFECIRETVVLKEPANSRESK